MLLLGGAALALVGIAVTGILMRVYSGSPGDRKRCAENLQAIGQACLRYAHAHQGSFPPALKGLARADSPQRLSPEQLFCPNAGKKGRGGNYVYVPGLRSTDDPGTILVYEPLGNHKKKPGGHVLRVSGLVEWLNEEQHKAAVAQIKTRQPRTPPGR